MKHMKLPILILALALILTGCAAQSTDKSTQPTQAATQTAVQPTEAPATEAPATQAAAQPTEAASADAGALVIPAAELTGDMQVYGLDMDGVNVEVIALIASDGSIRTAFNACQVCYDSGMGYYKQVGKKLVCQNCGNQFALDQLGLSGGGCNPVPIKETDRTTDGTSITISADVLKTGEVYFQNRVD